MLKYISAIFTTLLLGIGAAQACTAPPIACNLGPGILLPDNSVQEWGGTAGPRTLASASDPEWDWDSSLSYAYIYSHPINNSNGGSNWLGFNLSFTWQWSQSPPVTAPGSGHSEIVTIHCLVVGNDGEIWYEAVNWQYGFYDNGSGNAINCPMPPLVNGFGPSTWFNHNGQSAASSVTVAQQYATLFGNNQNIFAMGLVFGDNVCTPNWASSTSGNVNCWVDGAYAGRSHFKVIGAFVY